MWSLSLKNSVSAFSFLSQRITKCLIKSPTTLIFERGIGVLSGIMYVQRPSSEVLFGSHRYCCGKVGSLWLGHILPFWALLSNTAPYTVAWSQLDSFKNFGQKQFYLLCACMKNTTYIQTCYIQIRLLIARNYLQLSVLECFQIT